MDQKYSTDEWTDAYNQAEGADFDAAEVGEDYPLARWICDLTNGQGFIGKNTELLEGLFNALEGEGVKSFSSARVVEGVAAYQGESDSDFTELAEEYAQEQGGDAALNIMTTMAKESEWGDGDFERWYLRNARPGSMYGFDSVGTLHWFDKSHMGL